MTTTNEVVDFEATLPAPVKPVWAGAYKLAAETLGADQGAARKYAAGVVREYTGWTQDVAGRWLRAFAAPKSRAVAGVEVMMAGTHTDMNGTVQGFTKDDLADLVRNFQAGIPGCVPLKAGHTSDEFNRKLAAALSVPQALVSGEGDLGLGQIGLGRVARLYQRGDRLVADFAEVPEPIADMIAVDGTKTGFSDVSCEITLTRKLGMVMTAVALLGAEFPAVEKLAGLKAAVLMSKGDGSKSREPVSAYFFSRATLHMQGPIPGATGGTVDENLLRQALGIGPADDLMAALQAVIQQKAGGMTQQNQTPMMNPDQMVASPQFQQFSKTLRDELETKFKTEREADAKRIAALETALGEANARERRVLLTQRAAKWSDVVADTAAEVEALLKLSQADADRVAVNYDAMAGKLKQSTSVLFGRVGAPAPGGTLPGGTGGAKHPFEKKVEEHATANKLSFQRSLVILSGEDKDGYSDYVRTARASN